MADVEEPTTEIEEPGASNDEILIAAARRDHVELLQQVLDQPGTFDVNHTDGIGNTALHYAASYSATDCVKLLLQVKGVRLDIKNSQWETPLHLAAAANDIDIVKMLIESGANPNALTKQKQKPAGLTSDPDVKRLLQGAVLATQLDAKDIADDDDEEGEGEEDD